MSKASCGYNQKDYLIYFNLSDKGSECSLRCYVSLLNKTWLKSYFTWLHHAYELSVVIQVAGAVSFLLSPAAAYVTGTTIDVDGASSKVFVSNIPTAGEAIAQWNGFMSPISLNKHPLSHKSLPPNK